MVYRDVLYNSYVYGFVEGIGLAIMEPDVWYKVLMGFTEYYYYYVILPLGIPNFYSTTNVSNW